MAWGSKTTMFEAATVASTYTFGSKTTLGPLERAYITIKCVRAGTVDDLDIAIISGCDSSTYTSTDAPDYSYTMGTTAAATSITSFQWSGTPFFKVGAKSAGATDQHTVTINAVIDGVST